MESGTIHKDLQIPEDHFMSPDMFTRILDAFPETKHVQPQWFGESFLHPDFSNIVEICKQKGRKVSYYTNGSLIHKHPEAVSLLDPGDAVKLSVEAMDKETYEKVRKGLKWERLLKNVDLINHLKCRGVKLIVRTMKTEENKHNFRKVREYWKNRADVVQTETEAPRAREVGGDWSGKAICSRPYDHFTVTSDGRVTICCMDWEKTFVLGSIQDETPRDLWERTEDIRHPDKPLCLKCPMRFVPDGD